MIINTSKHKIYLLYSEYKKITGNALHVVLKLKGCHSDVYWTLKIKKFHAMFWHTLHIRVITQRQSGQLDFLFINGITGIYLLVIISVKSEFIFCTHSLLCILISDYRQYSWNWSAGNSYRYNSYWSIEGTNGRAVYNVWKER